jgi:hypothetical protein
MSIRGFTPAAHPHVGLAALCFHDLGAKSLWLDEGFSVALASDDWPRRWELYVRGPNALSITFCPISGQRWEATKIQSDLSRPQLGIPGGLLAALLFTMNAFLVRYAQ